jgi:hypothetical protein
MLNTKEIKEKINSDFADDAGNVFKILEEAITKAAYLDDARILRCLVFLADKDVPKLKVYIGMATTDPRDLMMCAEYISAGNGKKLKEFTILVSHLISSNCTSIIKRLTQWVKSTPRIF